MLHQLRNRNFYLMVAADMGLFAAALFGAYLVRFDFDIPRQWLVQLLTLLPFVIPLKCLSFFGFGVYRGMWRYSSISDMWRLSGATLFSSLIIVSAIVFFHRFQGYSRGVFLIDGVLTFVFTGALRVTVRTIYSRRGRVISPGNGIQKDSTLGTKPIIIIGAGDGAEMTLRELYKNGRGRYRVVGLVDDDRKKHGRLIHGARVLGRIDELPQLVEKFSVRELLVAIPSATGSQMRYIVEVCERCGVPYKTLPGLGEVIDGRVRVSAIRDVNYNDLLKRKPVRLESSLIKDYLGGRRVLVTGAGGSIGSELCRQIVKFEPEEMLLVDCSEANLYDIQMEIEHYFEYSRYKAILKDVKDRAALHEIMVRYNPQVVVHAAAYKHVPMLEANPWEAVFNNIVGSKNVLEASVAHGVKRVVMVSTDKAVRPTSVMGASKRVCELIMQTLNGQNGTRMMCVRFGNVLGSSGSVLPLFKKQISKGGPITVTHPEVTRYFMTIPEACQLILQAGAMGKGGEIFILRMGEPVRIVDMARDLIRLSGKEPDKDIEIVFTGLRPGEKLYEELITDGEGIVETEHEKIMVLRPDDSWCGHGGREQCKEWLERKLDEILEAAISHDAPGIRDKLKEIVPEYQPASTQ